MFGGVTMNNLFEYYIETNNFYIKYAKGEPAAKDQEFHNYNEFVLFIGGYSSLISKNIQQKLTRGSLIIIPKEHFHHFCVDKPQTYERLILGFYDSAEINELISSVMNTIKVIPIPDEKVVSLLDNLIQIVKSNICEENKKLFIHSSLIQLLIYLEQNTADVVKKSIKLSSEVSQALGVIDEMYSKNLSIKHIADMLCISPSTLSHKFSKELDISLYLYITKKRLMEAHKLIENGELSTSAAIKCGFSDYSCFYRLYKKYYTQNEMM